jgi:DNA-nicking Smr family endonuclease
VKKKKDIKNLFEPFLKEKNPSSSLPSVSADDSLWDNYTHGVHPLKNREHYVLKTPPSIPSSKTDAPHPESFSSKTEQSTRQWACSVHREGEQVWGAVSGVSKQVLHALRSGHWAVHHTLDLHGFTLDEAQQSLVHWVRWMHEKGERCVLVVTGKGLGSVAGVGVIKQHVPEWLSKPPLVQHVLAFCTAQPKDGGTGAFYVLLRRR